jgi:hypothetical protein
MHRSIFAGTAFLLLSTLTVASAVAAQKDDPKKFNYQPIPVEVSCLSGYHPSTDKDGNKVFPCVADAAIVAPNGTAPLKAAPSVVKAN